MTAPFPVPGGEAHAQADWLEAFRELGRDAFRDEQRECLHGAQRVNAVYLEDALDIFDRQIDNIKDRVLAEVARLTAERNEVVRQLAEDHHDPYMALHLARERVRMHAQLQRAEAAAARCVTLTEAIDSYRRLGDGMVTSAADEDAGTVTEVHTLDALERLHAVLAGSSGGEKP